MIPQDADAAHDLAVTCCREERLPDAVAALEKAVAFYPRDARLWNDLGAARWLAGSPEAARACFDAAYRLHRDDREVAKNLGRSLMACRDFDGAVPVLRRLVARGGAALQLPLGQALLETWANEEAARQFRAAMEREAERADALAGLSELDIRAFRPHAAAVRLRESVRLLPSQNRHSALARLAHFDPKAGRAEIFEEHRAWGAAYGPAAEGALRRRRRKRGRLRVAYLSGIFEGHHAQLGAIVRRHDLRRFDVYCLHDGRALDDPACQWVDVSELSNAAAASLIRELEIDILVEPDGHFRKGVRLPVFGMRAAAAQIALPLYPGSLGVPGIDYRVTDGVVDPPGCEAHFSERLLRLSEYLPFDPGPLPAARRPRRPSRRPVVFGSFSGMTKIHAGVIDCWARVLLAVPQSRLLIQHRYGRTGSDVNPGIRRRLRAAFARRGVDPARIDLRGWLPRAECVALHNQVDIALDTFPYNGTLTTLHALWMGVPVVTLAGDTSAGRVGMSILSAMGLGELVAGNAAEYVRVAEGLARSGGLGDRIAAGRGDPARYVRELEEAYLQVWRMACA